MGKGEGVVEGSSPRASRFQSHTTDAAERKAGGRKG